MKKIIIEVGSTSTKIDLYDGNKVKHLDTICIFFKKSYNKEIGLNENDIQLLIKSVNDVKKISRDIYVCGTSIFRILTNEQKEKFLMQFKRETSLDFNIISSERENELTVIGATKNVNSSVAVFVGGGGSTEIAVYDKGIKEMVNTPIGVMDIMKKYPDLAQDLAKTDLSVIEKEIKDNLNLPKQKVDILILAGGAHKYFALNSGISYEENTLYSDELQPIMMDIESRKKETKRYYGEISLDKIRNKVDDPKWWYATRAMSAFALVVAKEIEAKYIIPTDISMVYGIIEELKECN